MELKRHYDPAAQQAYKLAAEAAKRAGRPEPPPPPITHFGVVHTGTSPEQNFSDRMIDACVASGAVTISGDRLSIKTAADPLRYAIKRRPGYWCKSTGEPIPMSDRAWLKFRLANDSTESRAVALAWLAAKGLPADDYDITTAYHCVLDAVQHAKFKAVSNGGIVKAAHEMVE